MASNTASRCMTRLESVNADSSKKNSQRARVSRERPARRCCTVRSCGHNCAIFSDGRANFPALGHGRAECLQCCQSVIQDPKIADCQQAFAHGSVSHENHAKRWQANDKSPSPLGARIRLSLTVPFKEAVDFAQHCSHLGRCLRSTASGRGIRSCDAT